MNRLINYSERVKELFPNLEIIEPYINCNTKILHKCSICGNIFYKRPDDVIHSKQGCPNCSAKKRKNSLKKSHEQYLKDILNINNNWVPLEPYINAHTKILHRCNICGGEFKISPFDLEQNKVRCPLCNSIWNSPYKEYFSKFLTEDQMKKYSPGSGKKVLVKCPDCGREKEISINTLRDFGMRCICGDGISYPNKFMYKFLELLGIEFIPEYHPKWANNRRYDIYIPSLNCIIENHGNQHYKDVNNIFETILEEQQSIDKYKKEIAIQNGITNYIELDCSVSEQVFISNSILNNGLLTSLILIPKDFNWRECNLFASSNFVRKAAELWNEGLTVQEIYQKLNIAQGTVTRFLKRAKELNLCSYTKEEAYKRKSILNNRLANKKYTELAPKVAELWNSPIKYSLTDIGKILGISWDVTQRSIIVATNLGLCVYAKNRISKISNKLIDKKLERKNKIIEMWNNGYSISKINKETNISTSTIQQILKEANFEGLINYSTKESRSRGRLGINKHMDWTQKIAHLWNQGYGTKDIEKEMNLGTTSIHNRILLANQLGLCNYTKKENDKRNNSYTFTQIRNSNAKMVKCVETGIIYKSAGEASRSLGLLSSSGICAVCNGKQKKSHGYHWAYVDKNN